MNTSLVTRRRFGVGGMGLLFPLLGSADEIRPYKLPKATITPLADHQAVFEAGGREFSRWHFPSDYPRPFFYPFCGPSEISLTRMGHPGAPNHDHHQSIWFAHHDVNKVSFWANSGAGRIKQKDWLCYEDGQDKAVMAVLLGWYDSASGKELMEQQLIAIFRPMAAGEQTLELQSTFRAVGDRVELGKTNFGLLAVRVAKSISAAFGGGKLTDSEGRIGEPDIFGKQAKWMDYSGPIKEDAVEGVTFFDHPDNPRYPSYWHVRSDGWMGASFCLAEGFSIAPEVPLRLRYLLHAHAGEVDSSKASSLQADFAKWRLYDVIKGKKPHHQFELVEQ
ncbi:MAG: PmoA family protein [Verrucomicrobiaceae bacterium]|nr:PmoA family protein [Verrucomicrobiaceae bacterium]